MHNKRLQRDLVPRPLSRGVICDSKLCDRMCTKEVFVNHFEDTWRIPASTLGWHAAVALMTGCGAQPTMYRIGSEIVSDWTPLEIPSSIKG